jgi:hypothetical protein
MKITIERKYKKDTYTIGRIYIDGVYFCDSLEDKDRNLDSSMSLEDVLAKKVYGETAIPYGTYDAEVTYSPKFKRDLLLIKDVKGFTGIRVHNGSFATDSLGCILCGKNTHVGMLSESKKTLEAFMKRIEGEKDITVEIIR